MGFANREKEVFIPMARTANVFVRVEPEVKEQAEQGIPFEMKLPAYEEPVAYGSLTKELLALENAAGQTERIMTVTRIYAKRCRV